LPVVTTTGYSNCCAVAAIAIGPSEQQATIVSFKRRIGMVNALE
jgi:hypothetical protein